jgi:SPP1 gp7 family putative phage head morphogenesis protein
MNQRLEAFAELVASRRRFAARRGRRLPKRTRVPPPVYPRAIELFYLRLLRGVVSLTRDAVKQLLYPELPSIVEQAKQERGDAIRTDSSSRRARDAIERAAKRVTSQLSDSRLERMAEQVAERTNDHQRRELYKQMHAIAGVDVLAAEPNLRPKVDAFVSENVSLIRSIPRRALDQVETLVSSRVTAGDRADELMADIAERFDVSESRAALIARDQVGKFHGALTKARHQALGLELYEWSTAGDERVRDEHAARDGKRYSWDDPPEDGHPGEPIQCRCVAVPIVDTLMEAVEEAEDEE